MRNAATVFTLSYGQSAAVTRVYGAVVAIICQDATGTSLNVVSATMLTQVSKGKAMEVKMAAWCLREVCVVEGEEAVGVVVQEAGAR